MIRYRLLFIVILGAITLVFGELPPGYAQEEDPLEFKLEDVVVTALKREMDHQKVPIQMEVISGADLVGTGKDNVDDILRDISNIIINKGDDGMRITLRGLGEDEPLGANGALHLSTPQVALNIDGAYNKQSTAGQNLFDIERMEVLSGPQSTLYGSNSPGGIVNVVTASPKADRFEARASAEFGSFNLSDYKVMVNVPIVKDLLAMRLATQWYKRDSWMEGGSNAQETRTARLKTKFEPSETFDTTVTINYSEAVSGGRLGGTARLFDHQDGHYWTGEPVTNPWTASNRGGFTRGPAPDDPVPHPMQRDSETKGIQAEVNWDTTIGSVALVPSYSKNESTDFRDDIEVYFAGDPTTYYTSQKGTNHTIQKSAELRIVSPEDFPFEWIVGGTWLDSEDEVLRDDLFYDNNDSSQTLTRKTKAVYANITYPITDQFRGTGGYRYSWDDVQNEERGGKKGYYLWGQVHEAPDYKVGMEYDLSEDSMLWANWATSYRVDPMAAEKEQGAEAETLDAYSVGIKNRFLNDKLQVNASAYYYNYENKWFRGGYSPEFARGAIIKESAYPHDGLPGTDFNYDGDYIDTNLPPGHPQLLPGESSDLVGYRVVDDYNKQFGGFESVGVDVSMDWVFTRKDRLSLTVSYLDSEWTDAVVDFYWSWVWPDQGYDFSGSKAILAPKWSAHASYEHRFDLGNFGSLTPIIDFQYKDDYILSFNRDLEAREPGSQTPNEFYRYPWNYQEAHWIWNASLMFNHSSDRWSVRAYVKNIDDYASKNFFAGRQEIAVGLSDPKQYGVVVTGNY